MAKVAKNSNANIIELVAVLKKRLCSTWKSDAVDQQAIDELKSAISKNKKLTNHNDKSDLDQILSDFENWVYEADTDDTTVKVPMHIVKSSRTKKPKPNTQTT